MVELKKGVDGTGEQKDRNLTEETKILVTGASGNVGGPLAEQLQRSGVAVKAGVFDEREADELGQRGVSTVPFDFNRPETFGPALRGVQAIFLMRPPQIADVENNLIPFVDFALDQGVEKIVFLSLLGADRNPWTPHAKVERHLEQVEAPYVFLRPSFFMQNLSTTHAVEIREKGVIDVPVGNAGTNFIDARDIASVAAKVLTEPGHLGQAYALTGREPLDYHQVARIMSDELDHEVKYRQPTLPGFIWRSLRRGKPFGMVMVMSLLYTLTRFGMAEDTTDQVEQLLDREPRTMREFVRDYRQVWLQSSP